MTERWIVPLTPHRSGRPRLLCLPYAGGGAAAFGAWPDALPDGPDVYAVRPPGRESRLFEDPVPDLDRTLAPLLEELATWPGHLPWAVFGHSMGALVGFELVRAVRRAGVPAPRLLVVSGAVAPHLAVHAEPLHALPDDRLLAALREYGGTPEALLDEPELLELFLPALRADFALVENHRFRPDVPLDVPTAVFRGTADHEVPESGTRAWSELITAPVSRHAFEGGHFFVEQARADVLSTLAALFDEHLPGRGSCHVA